MQCNLQYKNAIVSTVKRYCAREIFAALQFNQQLKGSIQTVDPTFGFQVVCLLTTSVTLKLHVILIYHYYYARRLST